VDALRKYLAGNPEEIDPARAKRLLTFSYCSSLVSSNDVQVSMPALFDAETLRKIVVDLAEQLDRSLAEQNEYQSLLRELREAQRSRKSEQLSKEQLALFESAWKARSVDAESTAGEDDDDLNSDAGAGAKPNETPSQNRGGRQALARRLKREKIVHDPAEAEKRCAGCGKDLRLIAEETSERYEYHPASMKVIQDVCLKYACDCTVRTAAKPPQPIEKSTRGSELIGASDRVRLHAHPIARRASEASGRIQRVPAGRRLLRL
jgi:transposase